MIPRRAPPRLNEAESTSTLQPSDGARNEREMSKGERVCAAGGKKVKEENASVFKEKKREEMHETWISKDRHRTNTSISTPDTMLQTRKRDTDTFQSAPKREEKSV